MIQIARATHPVIMAYRIQLSETGAFAQDCDDDGESAAGGRLLHLLQVGSFLNYPPMGHHRERRIEIGEI